MPSMSSHDDRSLDAVFRALADSTRRLILEELAHRDRQPLFEICVRMIEQHQLSLSRQAISKHLAVLEDAGLVTTEWEGRTKLHSSRLAVTADHITAWLNAHSKRQPS